MRCRLILGWISVLAACGCSPNAGNSDATELVGGTVGAPSGGPNGSTTTGDPAPFVPPVRASGPSGADAACNAVVQRAEKRSGGRADIVFALDNSGSMTEEVLAVQNNMNAFSNQIASSGIDAHVVVISSGPPGGRAAPCTNYTDPTCWQNIGSAWAGSNGVCVDPPLGAPGACPANDDTNLPGYMHWRVEIGSHNALATIQNTFSGWQGMLRPDAAKTFVVVTDDENVAPPTGADFANWVNAQKIFQSAVWRFSGIFCVTASNNCAGQGVTYRDLANQTGGISGDMASFASGQVDAQFKAVFGSLAQAVVSDAVPVDCEWAIPPPPNGEQLDPNAVNVHFTGSSGQTQTLYGVNAPSECTDQYGGWFYDDPVHPTRVVACPQSCHMMQADDNARVEVLFGCARETAPVH